MNENNEQIFTEEQLKDLPIQSENIAFGADEMILCGKCSRNNPPNRLNCFYCGSELELSKEQTENVKPHLRKLENWEKGFNLIYLPTVATIEDEATAQIAKFFGLEIEHLQAIFKMNKPLPLVRTETLREAVIFENRFSEAGLNARIVGDEALAPEIVPKRLRGLEFEESKISLILFNNDEIEIINGEDLNLIVLGAIFQKKIESTEKRKKGESKILSTSEMASDDVLIDFYSKNNANGYRIMTKGFDFSCLGAEKGILARENLQKLIVKLQNFAPNIKLVNDYLTVREILGEVWEVEQRKDPQGLKRQSFGRFDFANIASSNNEQQFTKYSRLQWHIL